VLLYSSVSYDTTKPTQKKKKLKVFEKWTSMQPTHKPNWLQPTHDDPNYKDEA